MKAAMYGKYRRRE